MEAIKRTVRTPKNREIRIRIPDQIPENEPVEIILVFGKGTENFDMKINELKTAMNDELFLSDLKEISSDFDRIDLENWPV
ncbi:MAG: hypothetical protein GXO75_08165 [Calditrichaeota bacterium]|nr:hypothetical protein [Actinomycetota bacterium]NOY58895.1 hypothetical protein [Calditrichota bacterium]